MSIHRGRLRLTVKWAGAALTVLLLVVWIWSGNHIAQLYCGPTFTLEVCQGQFAVGWEQPWSLVPRDVTTDTLQYASRDFKWWFKIEFDQVTGWAKTRIFVPLWFAILLTASPTFLIWRHDRRRLANACPKCGYDRTGHPADRACPECGASSAVTPII